jgi:hypothetical protein
MENTSAKDFLTNPDWMPWEVTEQWLSFRHMTAERVRSAAFLDGRSAQNGDQVIKLSLSQLRTLKINLHQPQPVVHIFHLSHVGSTFIGRLLADVDELVVLREPQVLRGLVQLLYRQRFGQISIAREELEMIIGKVVALLGRTANGRVAIKHTSSNLSLAPLLSNDFAPNGSLAIYTSLEDFLAHSMVSDGLKSDSISNGERRLMQLNELLYLDQLRLSGLSFAQIVAVNWLIECHRMMSLQQAFPAVKLIDFDRTASQPELLVDALTAALPVIDDGAKQKLLKSEAWGKSAKSGKDFTYADRANKLADSKSKHGDQIQSALKWARTLVLRNPALAAVLPLIAK